MILQIILPINQTKAQRKSAGQNLKVPASTSTKEDTKSTAQKEYFEAEKKLGRVGFGASVCLVLGLITGFFKYGSTFPAKALEVLGDICGSASGVLAPFSIIGNEIKNYYLLKEGKNGNGTEKKEKGIFDDWREGFYRISSMGFFPFIFEPFINPEKLGQSIFHKIAAVANIPNLFFTGYTWGIGNCKAFLAWILREKEQIHVRNAKPEDKQKFETNVEGFDQLYKSFKRMAVIGSIANPTLQGLRQCADSLAFITGKMSAGEFFSNPFLGLSRLVSLFVGIPETFAKGVDSLVRVVRERESLRLALPKFLRSKKVFDALEKIENKIASPTNTTLKEIRHTAETFFHTLSPLSMFALFTPLLGEKHINEEAQSRGGLPAFLNRIIGGYGATITATFTGLYVALARLPQAIFQIAYFSKKLPAKFGGKEATREELENLKERMLKSTIVDSLSNLAQKCINYLVPDFYNVEHDHGYLTYEQIQANHSFDQARGHFNGLLQSGSKLNDEQKENIVKHCVDYVTRDARQGKYNELTNEEKTNIAGLIRKKIEYTINPELQPQRKVKLPFIGAEFLATWVFKLFDLRTRLKAIDYRSSHHNMTTAYENDECRISFEYELLPVVSKCTKGLGNTVNRIFGIAA